MTTPQELRSWAFKNDKFINLQDGESMTALFKDAKSAPSSFGSEKETMEYTLQFPDGITKSLQSGSPQFAKKMAELFGKTVTITRHGVGSKTKYDVVLFEGDCEQLSNSF